VDELRLADSIATLNVATNIIRNFLVNYLEATPAYAEEFVVKASESVYHQASILIQALKNDDPDQWAVSTIKQMIATKELLVSDGKPSLNELRNFDGYSDEGYINFLPDKLYAAVNRMAKTTGTYFCLNQDEFIKSLGEYGILKSIKNGSGHRKFSSSLKIDNVSVKFVRVIRSKLE